MPVDKALLGTWKLEGQSRSLFYEITSTGVLLFYSPWVNFEVSPDGLQLVVHYPSETVTFDRIGDPDMSLLGSWTRTHPDDPPETHTYYDNNSYTIDWDGSDWGVFVYTQTALLAGEFRGQVSTNNGVYTQDYSGNQTHHNYTMDGPDRVVFIDPDTGQQVWVFVRLNP